MRLISREVEVALNVLHCLSSGDAWTSYQLSEQLKESRAFVAQVTHKLARAKIIKARNGRHGGGYKLLKDPGTIPVSAVLRVFGKTFHTAYPEGMAGPEFMLKLDAMLKTTTLHELIGFTSPRPKE